MGKGKRRLIEQAKPSDALTKETFVDRQPLIPSDFPPGRGGDVQGNSQGRCPSLACTQKTKSDRKVDYNLPS